MAIAETAALVASLELEDKFSKTADRYEKALSGMDKRTTKTTSTLGKIGQQTQAGLGKAAHNLKTVGLVAGGVAVAGMVAATRAAIDFESAFTGVVKTVDEADLAAAGLTFEDLSDGIREMSRELPIAATELAAIGEQAGALGIAGKDILEFTRVVALIGTTTDVSSDMAATALGQLSNVLNLTAADYDNFGAALVDLGNKGASTEAQILEITRRFGATGAQAGLSAQEVLAFSSAAANLGLQSELSGGALQRFFIRTQKFVQSNDINLQNMAETAGLTKKAFADLFAEDAASAILKFIQGMEKLEKSERAAMLASLEFSNQTGLNQLLSGLSANSDNLAKSLNTSADAWRANTALTAEAEKRFATTESSLQILRNNLTDIGITIGSAVLPKVAALSKEFTDFLQGGEAQAAIKGFAEQIPVVMDELVGFAKSLPWDAIKTTFQVMAVGSRALLTAFTSMPPWVQTAVLTGWGLNKLTGGALGNIAGTLAKAVFGQIRGATPATPVFTKEVGLGGGPGGAPVAGGGRGVGGALLGGLGKLIGVGIALEVGREVGLALARPTVEPAVKFEESQWQEFLNNPAATQNTEVIRHNLEAVDAGLDDLIGENREGRFLFSLLFGDQLAVLEGQEATLQKLLREAERRGPVATAAAVPVELKGAPRDAATFAIRELQRDTVRALKDGDLHTARIAQRQLDALHTLRGTFDRRINELIPHLGKTHSALTIANRKLDEGNARQREIASAIGQARDRISTGFQSSNAQLGVIAAKEFSPNITVTGAPITVSINDVIRASSTYNAAVSVGSQLRRGFTP